jgi:2-methylcitrate dehydratase PrpD
MDVKETAARDGKLTARIVSFAIETRLSDLSIKAIDNAKVIIMDTFGACLAAAPLHMGQILTRYAVESGGKAEATIIGGKAKVPATMAALVNGSLANALDYNESSHVATHVMPAALALAERDGRSGADFLDAFAIGFEAGYRLAQAYDGARTAESGPTYRGWWHVGLVSPIAGAIAAARLLRLDRDKTARAIGIATCSSGGFRRNMGTMAKAYHSGHGSSDGIQAALLASQGFTADPEILEAPLGFLAAVCQPEERDDAAIAERLGNPFVLEDKPRIKPFPSCTRSHKGIDAALDAHAKGGYKIEDIVKVEADFNAFSLLRPEAESEDAAGFSAPFLISSALVNGAMGLDQLSEKSLHDKKVRALMAKFTHAPTIKGRETVTLRLKDGSSVVGECSTVRRLEAKGEIEEKYRDSATRRLTAQAAAELQDLVLSIEKQSNLARIMTLAGGA